MALPPPEPGLVISYGYVWRRQQLLGQEEGLKDRPCVIILAVERQGGDTLVTLSPMTHTPPDADTLAVEIPRPVKAHLGLDDLPSWVIVNEVNQFTWPGFDIRPAGKKDSFGFLPPKLFERIKAGVIDSALKHHLKIVRRDV